MQDPVVLQSMAKYIREYTWKWLTQATEDKRASKVKAPVTVWLLNSYNIHLL